MTDFTTLLNTLQTEMSGAPPAGKTTAVFYSGTSPNGDSNEELANQCTKNNSTTYTIDMTTAGGYFDSTIKPAFTAGQITQAQYWQLGNVASQMFTNAASGDSVAFVDGASASATFGSVELPLALGSNTGLTSINGISLSNLQSAYGSTANFQSVVSNLAVLDPCFSNGPPPSASAPVTSIGNIQSSTEGATTVAPPVNVVTTSDVGTASETELNIAAGLAITAVAASYLTGVGEVATAIAAGVALLSAEEAGAKQPTAPSSPSAQSLYQDQLKSNQALQLAPALAQMRDVALVASGAVGSAADQGLPNAQTSFSDLESALQSGGGADSGAVDLPSGQKLDVGLSMDSNDNITYTETTIGIQTDGSDLIGGNQKILSQSDVFSSTGVDQQNTFNFLAGGSQVQSFVNLPSGLSSIDADYSGEDGSGMVTGGLFNFTKGIEVAFNQGTISDLEYTPSSSIVNVGLTAPDGNGVGTLTFNTSTNAASFALTLEGGAPGFNDHVSFALPSLGKDTVAALSSTTTPYQALKSYLADLGYTASLTTLNFNDLNPTGTAYDVTGTVTGLGQSPANGQTVADVAYTPYLRPGAQIDGQATAMYNGGTTYNAYNIIDILTGTFVDLTQDSFSFIQALALTGSGDTAELTSAQFGSLPDITGSGTLVITTAGNVSLTAVDAQPDHGTFNLTAQGWGGTVLNGDATNGQVLTASLYGNDTLNAGSGFFDGLVAGQGVDILNAPGFDTILAADGLAAGSKASGVAGETVLDAGGDISHATISGITTLTLGGNSPLGLTASQLALFTTIYLAGDNAIDAEAGGTYNLLNAPFANASAGMSIALNAVSNSATTLEGNDTSGGSGLISLLTALGNGADTLSTGGAAGDSLTASGSGNDKLTAGNGNNDTLSATGNGNDTLSAGGGNNDSLSASGNGSNTLNAGNGTADSLTASGTGVNVLKAGNGAGDTLAASNGTDTLNAGNGAGDTLTVTTGGNTLTAGSGKGDMLTAEGGGNILNGGSGGDTFTLYDDDNLATGGSGNDTFYLEGSSQPLVGDSYTLDLAGSTISGGAGTNTLILDNGDYETLDVSSGTLSGIEVITGMQSLIITAGEMAGLTGLSFGGSGSIQAVTPGAYSVAFDTMDAVSMEDFGAGGAVTLTGNNVAGGKLWGVNAGDVLTEGNGAGDAIIASGVNSTLTTGSGAGDTLSASGSNSRLTAGSGANDSLSASGSGNTMTASGTSGTLSDIASGTGNSFTLKGTTDTATVNGSSDMVTLSESHDIATVNAATGTATVNAGTNTLILTGSSAESVTFQSTTAGTLKLETPTGFTGTVAGLAAGDHIDLTSFLFSGAPTISKITGTGAAGTTTDVTVTDGSKSAILALMNQYANQFGVSSSAYTLAADSTGKTAGTFFELAAAH